MELRQSALETYFSCQAKYDYTYNQGFEPVHNSREMDFGTGVHAILEQCYKGTSFSECDWSKWPLSDLERKKAFLLIQAHLKYYPVPEDVIGVEQKFKLADGLEGTFDAVRKTANGEIVVVDHKTTGTDLQYSDAYWDKLKASNWQAGIYQLAAQHIHQTADVSLLWNVLRVPNFKLTKRETEAEYIARIAVDIDENPGKYFAQARVKWSDRLLNMLWAELTELAQRIPKQKYFPKSRKCFEFNRRCSFYPTCFEGEPLTNDKLYKIRERK